MTDNIDIETEAQFRTESIDDLEELLARASNWADVYTSDTIAAEFRDAQAFVESELSERSEVSADD